MQIILDHVRSAEVASNVGWLHPRPGCRSCRTASRSDPPRPAMLGGVANVGVYLERATASPAGHPRLMLTGPAISMAATSAPLAARSMALPMPVPTATFPVIAGPTLRSGGGSGTGCPSSSRGSVSVHACATATPVRQAPGAAGQEARLGGPSFVMCIYPSSDCRASASLCRRKACAQGMRGRGRRLYRRYSCPRHHAAAPGVGKETYER